MQREAQADPQLAIQLGILEALEWLHGSKKSGGVASSLEELLYGSGGMTGGHNLGEEDFAKLLSGAKGSAALLKLSQAIEQEPRLWVNHFNETIWRALGSDVSGLPWSVQRYGQARVRWGRLECHERSFAMLASLHSLAMRQEWDLLSAKVCQYLKAVEQSAQMGGTWKVPWLLTGLQEPRPGQGFGRGLVHAAEVAAASAYVKEMRTLEESMAKEGAPEGNPPGGAPRKDAGGAGRGGKAKGGRGE
eukprot:682216-Amphidinium_carterae.1